jgi:hypothetical protein
MESFQHTALLTVASALALISFGCASPKGDTPEAKRDYALSMKDKAMSEIYAKKPEAQADVEHSPGYATFDGIAYGLLFFGGGGGYGVVTDNTTKQVTYVKLFHFLPGFGVAGKGYKSVWVFEDADTFHKFQSGSWDFGATAEAAFKFGETGGSALGSGSFNKQVKVYEVTDGGIVLRAYLPISNVSQDKKLNEGAPTAMMAK